MFSFRCSNVARKFYICKYFLHLFSEIGENCENCVIGVAVGGGGWGCATFGAFIHFKSEKLL